MHIKINELQNWHASCNHWDIGGMARQKLKTRRFEMPTIREFTNRAAAALGAVAMTAFMLTAYFSVPATSVAGTLV